MKLITQLRIDVATMMGYTWFHSEIENFLASTDANEGFWTDGRDESLTGYMPDDIDSEVPDFTGNMSDADLVRQFAQKLGYRFRMESFYDLSGGFEINSCKVELANVVSVTSYMETMPLAICRATLSAMQG